MRPTSLLPTHPIPRARAQFIMGLALRNDICSDAFVYFCGIGGSDDDESHSEGSPADEPHDGLNGNLTANPSESLFFPAM